MHRPSIVIKAPKTFVDAVLWPEFQELNAALVAYLSEVTERVIREEVHRETGEAEEIDEPAQIGR
jgi:fumarylacetoacetate (FAA) hydrolase family protein